MLASDPHQSRTRPGVAGIATQWGFLATIVRQLAASEVGGRAVGLFVILVGLSLAVNGFNILNSFVGRDVITAVERKSRPEFLRYAALYVGVFALQTAVGLRRHHEP